MVPYIAVIFPHDSNTLFSRLRKVKMDQRKLMDNANTITDMAKTQNNVYEILSDVNSRQDIMDERIANLEDRINSIQCSLDVLPDILTR